MPIQFKKAGSVIFELASSKRTSCFHFLQIELLLILFNWYSCSLVSSQHQHTVASEMSPVLLQILEVLNKLCYNICSHISYVQFNLLFPALGITMTINHMYKSLETQISEKTAWKITQCLVSTKLSFPCPREPTLIWKSTVKFLKLLMLGSVTRQYLTTDVFAYCISRHLHATSVLHTKKQLSLGFYPF